MPQRHMKGLLALSAVIALSMAAAAPALSQATVATTKHNLSITSGRSGVAGATVLTGVTDYGQICVYCHAPHNTAAAANGPLWNRSAVAGSYTMYTSPTIDMTMGVTPGSQSMACLSCHDGTVALDVVINRPGGLTSAVGAGKAPAGSVLSQDLSNDHPIAVTYDPTVAGAVGEFVAVATVTTAGLKFYGASNKLECATCHNVHNNTNAPFLRKANGASALCLTCHIK